MGSISKLYHLHIYFLFIFLLYVYGQFAYVYLCVPHECHWRLAEDVRFSGTGIVDDCQLLSRCEELNSCSLEEQSVLLAMSYLSRSCDHFLYQLFHHFCSTKEQCYNFSLLKQYLLKP